MKSTFIKRLRWLFSRPDFRKNPFRAIGKRVWWRARWQFINRDWTLFLPNGLQISVPRGGSGALIYYQGWSEPEVALFLLHYLKPGMTFIDIGAHIGEYVLLAAPIVGPWGSVHAFEPDPRNYRLLGRNVKQNHLRSVHLNNLAVYKSNGIVQFEMSIEPSVSHLTDETTSEVSREKVYVHTVTLDNYVKEKAISQIDIIKIDVEGAELFALERARSILEQPPERAPVLIFEYSPANCRNFGYHPAKIIDLLFSFGYKTYLLTETGKILQKEKIEINPRRHVNLVAAKNEKFLNT